MRLHVWSNRIMDLQLSHCIDIEFVWLRRCFNLMADDLSKTFDFDDYEVTPEFFKKIITLVPKLSFDRFASEMNNKFPKCLPICLISSLY